MNINDDGLKRSHRHWESSGIRGKAEGAWYSSCIMMHLDTSLRLRWLTAGVLRSHLVPSFAQVIGGPGVMGSVPFCDCTQVGSFPETATMSTSSVEHRFTANWCQLGMGQNYSHLCNPKKWMETTKDKADCIPSKILIESETARLALSLRRMSGRFSWRWKHSRPREVSSSSLICCWMDLGGPSQWFIFVSSFFASPRWADASGERGDEQIASSMFFFLVSTTYLTLSHSKSCSLFAGDSHKNDQGMMTDSYRWRNSRWWVCCRQRFTKKLGFHKQKIEFHHWGRGHTQCYW